MTTRKDFLKTSGIAALFASAGVIPKEAKSQDDVDLITKAERIILREWGKYQGNDPLSPFIHEENVYINIQDLATIFETVRRELEHEL